MQNLLEELIQLLSEDERLVSEGKLLKKQIVSMEKVGKSRGKSREKVGTSQ